MKALLWLVLAQTAAGQTPSQAFDPFCRDLQRVLEVADRPEGFDQLERARPNPPSFGFMYGCRPSGASGHVWLCGQNLAPETLSRDRLAASVTACRPEAKALPSRHPNSRRFRLPGVEIRIYESGGPRAHVGRSVTFLIEANPAEPEPDD